MSNDDLCYLSAIELRESTTAARPLAGRGDRGDPGADRAAQPAAQRLRHRHRRARARPGRAAAERAYAATASRRPLAGIPISIKDLTPTKGIRTTRGSLLDADWIPDEDAPFVERVYAAGAVHARQDQHARVRLEGRLRQPRRRSDPQPLAARPHRRRLQRRRGGGGRGRARPAGAGQRRRRLDPHPRSLLRHLRAQTVVRARAAVPGQRGRRPLPPGADDPHRARRGAAAQRRRRRRPARPPLLVERRRLPRRARERGIAGLRVAWSPDLGYAAVEPAVREATERRRPAASPSSAAMSRRRIRGSADPVARSSTRSGRAPWPAIHARRPRSRCATGLDPGRLRGDRARAARSPAPTSPPPTIRRNAYYHGDARASWSATTCC